MAGGLNDYLSSYQAGISAIYGRKDVNAMLS
jgi:hypothetical protein